MPLTLASINAETAEEPTDEPEPDEPDSEEDGA